MRKKILEMKLNKNKTKWTSPIGGFHGPPLQFFLTSLPSSTALNRKTNLENR